METREKILNAAAEEFAGRGYDGATVRAICARAKVNVAAVNYHFSSKQELYMEVLAHLSADAEKWRLPDGAGIADSGEFRQRLRLWIDNFLGALAGVGSRQARLLTRLRLQEWHRASLREEEIFGQYMKPAADSLRSILEYAFPGDRVRLECRLFALLSSCLYYFGNNPAVRRISGDSDFFRNHLETIAEEIFQMHAAALPARNEEEEVGI